MGVRECLSDLPGVSLRGETLYNISVALPLLCEQATIPRMSISYGHILVVEDGPHIRQMLEVTLKFKGYPVVTVANGQEALE